MRCIAIALIWASPCADSVALTNPLMNCVKHAICNRIKLPGITIWVCHNLSTNCGMMPSSRTIRQFKSKLRLFKKSQSHKKVCRPKLPLCNNNQLNNNCRLSKTQLSITTIEAWFITILFYLPKRKLTLMKQPNWTKKTQKFTIIEVMCICTTKISNQRRMILTQPLVWIIPIPSHIMLKAYAIKRKLRKFPNQLVRETWMRKMKLCSQLLFSLARRYAWTMATSVQCFIRDLCLEKKLIIPMP